MAKKSRINTNDRRRKMIDKYKVRREELRKRSKDMRLALEERMEARAQLDLLPTNSAEVRHRRRCALTGRARGNLRKFGICRNALRLLAHQGVLPGCTKASW